MKLTGVWLPIITPFVNDTIDFQSYRALIDYYISKGISGLMPLGTTGESPTINDQEFEIIVDKTVEYVNGRLPIYVGVGGNDTSKVIKMLKTLSKFQVDGILSVSPYYSRPDQRGIYQHFLKITEATDLNIIVYNIPYRTGRNIENDTIYRLAELSNIIGLKDSCGDLKQSMDLLLNPPTNFSILTGEDLLYYSTLTLGGDGGILASAHLATDKFVRLFNSIKNNDHYQALFVWKQLKQFIPLLFIEPNPAPLKYILAKAKLITSSETRLPIVEITEELSKQLDPFINMV